MSGGWQNSDRKSRLPSNWATIRRKVLARDPICKLCGVRSPRTATTSKPRPTPTPKTGSKAPAPNATARRAAVRATTRSAPTRGPDGSGPKSRTPASGKAVNPCLAT